MTDAVVPRWEWRTFGARFGDAENAFAALTVEREQESEELYFIADGDHDTAKVRDGLMDVKHLERVDEHGLEQWAPVMKAGFPLPAAGVHAVLAALEVDASAPLARDDYTVDELVGDVIEPHPALLAVPVRKLRRRYTIGGCMAELTEVDTPHASTRTIALEADDPQLVLAAVRELGLYGRPNTNFPRGLHALVAGPGRYAVVDVGTNSVKFHVAERDRDGTWRTIVDRAEITRLGEGLTAGGPLAAEPIARTVDAIAAMADQADALGVRSTAAVGTAALRIAGNTREFVDAVRDRAGLLVEVVSGDDEAWLGYLAAVSTLPLGDGPVVVFEVGGGSAQFTFGAGGRIDLEFSVDVGAVSVSERFGLANAVAEDTVAAAIAAVRDELEQLAGRPEPDAVAAVGGTVTNLAAVSHQLADYDPDVVHGTVLDRAEIDRQIDLYRHADAEQRRTIVGLQPGRAEVILAGACIVRAALDRLDAASLTVSDRGLRHGLLVERFG